MFMLLMHGQIDGSRPMLLDWQCYIYIVTRSVAPEKADESHNQCQAEGDPLVQPF